MTTAATVDGYLADLTDEQRQVVSEVRELILRHLPPGYEEGINWGMIAYQVPLERYPDTYNGQPLMYAALSVRKQGYSLYLMSEYMEGEGWLKSRFEAAGKRLDMGKSCVRFRRLDDLPLGVIGEAIGKTPVEAFVQRHEEARAHRK